MIIKNRVAIDPGSSGGIVWGSNMRDVQAINMPKTTGDLWDLIKNLSEGHEAVCLMEKVGTYMPGNSGPSAATFAEHVGELRMALIASGMPHELVPPQSWQKAFVGAPGYVKIEQTLDESKEGFLKRKRGILTTRKTERKNKIKAQAQMIFPDITVTLANADALGIYWFGMQNVALWRD